MQVSVPWLILFEVLHSKLEEWNVHHRSKFKSILFFVRFYILTWDKREKVAGMFAAK